MKNQLRQDGFSLFEVLISILVLALGVIGSAGMQLVALRSNQEAAMQSLASQLAVEMADHIRANANSLPVFLGVDFNARTDHPISRPSSCYASTGCTPDELAAFDLSEWQRRIKNALPNGRAVICRDTQPYSSVSNALNWECTNDAASAPTIIKIGWRTKDDDRQAGFHPGVAVFVGDRAG